MRWAYLLAIVLSFSVPASALAASFMMPVCGTGTARAGVHRGVAGTSQQPAASHHQAGTCYCGCHCHGVCVTCATVFATHELAALVIPRTPARLIPAPDAAIGLQLPGFGSPPLRPPSTTRS